MMHLLSIHAQTVKCVVVGPPCFPVINHLHDILQKWRIKRDNKPPKYESVAKKQKVITLTVKFTMKVNGVTEEIADCGNVDTVSSGDTLAMQPGELKEGELTHKNLENGYDANGEDILEEMTAAKK